MATVITATVRHPHRPEENRAKENTCLIRVSWIISSELQLRCCNEEPLNEDILKRPGLLEEGIDTDESRLGFSYAYDLVTYDRVVSVDRCQDCKVAKLGFLRQMA